MTNKIHLIIGDAHAKPEINNRRFDWLGSLIRLVRPDVIIDIGDWEDMPSLYLADQGKLCYEGRRYKKDLEVAWDARRRVSEAINACQRDKESRAGIGFKPKLISLGGNHFEGRIKRIVNLNSALDGVLTVSDNKCQEYGWTYVPFLKPVTIDGITYCHYFQAKGSSRVIGGEYLAANTLKHKHTSCIQGHLHFFDYAHRARPDGSKIHSFVCGCYLDPLQEEEYAQQSNREWDKGLLVLKGVHNGDIDSFTWYGMEEIQDIHRVITKRK